jgi:uncharacterized protein (DUF433 family)
MMGKPVIVGTRITVEMILRECAAGLTPAELVEAYPGLNEPDVRAALAYAGSRLGSPPRT